MTTYNVILNNDTTGTISDETLDGQHPADFLGEYVNAHSHDENGNPIDVYGVLTEVS